MLASSWLTAGPGVAYVESWLAAYVGTAHRIAVALRTAELQLALDAAEIGPGDPDIAGRQVALHGQAMVDAVQNARFTEAG